MFSKEQLAKVARLAEQIETSSAWSLCVSRDKRKAQILDANGQSVFGGSWVLNPEQAEELLTLRQIFPELVKSLLTQEELVSTLADTIISLQEVFPELEKLEETKSFATKGRRLVEALIIEKEP